ncbi:MAG: P22 phage major capsid protein family protein [Blastocatellia bacterium]
MANTLTGLIPTIYQALDIVSREMVGFIKAVTRNSSAARAAVGQTITYHIVPAITAGDIQPGTNPPDDGDQTLGTDSLTISKSRYAPVRWSGEEQKSLTNGADPQLQNILRDQFAQAFRVLVNEVESDLGLTYKSASRAYGTAGTAPFGTAGDLSDLAQIRRILEDNGAPTSDLHIVLGSAAIANMRGKQNTLFKVNEAGTDELLRQGVIGMVEGVMVHNSAQVKTHTKGTGASYAVNNGAGYAVGSSTIAVDTGTGTIVAGDVLTNSQAGVDPNNKYVVKTALSGGSLVLNQPGIRSAWVDNDTVAVGNSYAANLGFSRNAIHLVTRAPAMPEGGDEADDVIELIDPISGLAFQIAKYRQYRRVKYEVGLAWGTKAAKSEHMTILLG